MNNIILNYYSGCKSSLGEGASLEAHGGRLLALFESAEQREKDLECLRRRLKLALFGRLSRCTTLWNLQLKQDSEQSLLVRRVGAWPYAETMNAPRVFNRPIRS